MWAFPKNWEKNGYSNTVEIIMNMMEPLHHTEKVVTCDSGFCVALGVTALHQQGVHGQFLINKRYWPKYVPGDYIAAYMMVKQL